MINVFECAVSERFTGLRISNNSLLLCCELLGALRIWFKGFQEKPRPSRSSRYLWPANANNSQTFYGLYYK